MPAKKLLTITLLALTFSFIISLPASAQSVNEPSTPSIGLIPSMGSTSSTVSASSPINTTNSMVSSSQSQMVLSKSSSNQPVSQSSNSSTSSVQQDAQNTPRTGGFSIFILLAIPIVVVLAYQYKYFRDSANRLNTEEKDINNN